MRSFFFRLAKMIFGFFLFALGIIITIQAKIGYAPWDVFHVGVSRVTGLSLGTVSILTGLVIILITALMKETLGIGSILNMLMIGMFIDLISGIGKIKPAGNFLTGLLMMMLGLLIVGIASYFYISAGFGAGPRDGLMVALSRKSGKSIGLCRGLLEFAATAAGYFLGGMAGIGTILYVVLIGIVVEIVFRLFRFDPKAVRHETMKESLAHFVKTEGKN